VLEPFLRANVSRFQGVYDRFPAPARDVLTSARGWFLTKLRYSPETLRMLDRLREHENWTPQQIEQFQLGAIRSTARHAIHNAPHYASYSRGPITSLAGLRQFPVLRRETVRANPESFLATDVPHSARIRAGTTGTTGGNLKVAYTEDLARSNWAFLLRQWAWAGIEPLAPRVTLFGARIVPAQRTQPPFWTHNLPEHQALMSIFHLSQKTSHDYLQFLQRQMGKVLEGFPSVLSVLADMALAEGITIPMRVVFTSGEPLYPAARAKIEQAFECRVFDSYGMTEYCGQIHECEHGQMHLSPEFGFLEILDENDEPAATGEEGYFVWTGFLNRAMPLIRYRIGDRGRWLTTERCECGRNFPRVVPTITRESEILHCPDGRIFSPRALNQLLKKSTSLRFCQFIHDQPERVIVRVGASAPSAAEEMMQVRTALEALLGPAMRVTAEIAEAPLTRPGGKTPLILEHVGEQVGEQVAQ
jgi:phenylacetate-CoA ligase